MAAYEAAKASAQSIEIGAKRTAPGTFSALIVTYYNSAEFHELADNTKRARRNILERYREGVTGTGLRVGDCRVAHLSRSRFEKMVAEKRATPGAARVFVKTMRVLMQFAISHNYRSDNPTAGVKLPGIKGDGWISWGEEQIAAFEAKHPVGTKARLALALLLYTAQRRGDVLRMGRQHLQNGCLRVRQQKTSAVLEVPVHPALQAILDATPVTNFTFLVTANGKPFSPNAFNKVFHDWCTAAGLPKGFHRMACAKRPVGALQNWAAPQIRSWLSVATGHLARQKYMSAPPIKSGWPWTRSTRSPLRSLEHPLANSTDQFANPAEKSLRIKG
ncbi:MAG: tyrosine-type recombinase/integrase [Xanthobacteraceae bacterium]